MSKIKIDYENEGVTLILDSGWEKEAALCDVVGALRRISEETDAEVSLSEPSIYAGHAAVAKLNDRQAATLGLPESVPFTFAADATGVIGHNNFRLTYRWLDHGVPIAGRRQGAFLDTSTGRFRISEPVYSAIDLVDAFDAADLEVSKHWSALARFRQMLDPSFDLEEDTEPENRHRIEMTKFMQNLRIYNAASFSLSLKKSDEGIDFDPVLFDHEMTDRARQRGVELQESDGLLSREYLDLFQHSEKTGFRAFDDAKGVYLLKSGVYVVLDDDLEAVLNVVREKQRSSSGEREEFARNPKGAIRESLLEQEISKDRDDELIAEVEADEKIEVIFQETIEYANRAYEVGVWEKPQFDFLPKNSKDWLPEVFPIQVGDRTYFIQPEDVEPIRKEIEKAISSGFTEVDYQGDPLPATPETLDQLDEVRGRIEAVRQTDPSELPEGQIESGPSKPEPIVIRVHENFVEENWHPCRPDRQADLRYKPSDLPDTVRTKPMAHQSEGISALVKAWGSSLPGFLNADDQGLGKTFQTLAFLAWLRNKQRNDQMVAPSQPFLIVAPVSLLQVWKNEAEEHLVSGELGALIPIYGSELKHRRSPGVELSDARPRLDLQDLQAAIREGSGDRWWVLTTYETLANYQHSFHEVEFSVVVFDEIQKLKNPATINAQAAKSVIADFRIGLTGTPIENHVADLWSIIDAIIPGRLGSMKDFANRYGIVNQGTMEELYARLFKSVRGKNGCLPPMAIRRLKEDCLGDLPRKDYRLYPEYMTEGQMQAYDEVRERLGDGARGEVFRLLHHIRSVSLHYRSARMIDSDTDSYIDGSARLRKTFDLLDQLYSRRERVLLFVEDHDMQYRIAEFIRARYNLREVKIINGEIQIRRRQERVEAFQQHLVEDGGFDVMILGPRAAGFGLTLTAATHVIHLSRWWNPAVEEQCNDRIYRIGQKNPVTIHLPMAIHRGYRENSFDCILNELMKQKRSLARAALWPPIERDSDIQILMAGLRGAETIDLTEIDNFDWLRFEHWVLDRCQETGEWECYETRRVGDSGADVVLKHKQRKDTWGLVQVKHRSNLDQKMDQGSVRDVLRAREHWGKPNPQLAVVTNVREFKQDAMELARAEDVRLVSRSHLSLWPSHILA